MTSGLEAQVFLRRSDQFALDLQLEIGQNTTVALLGPNGSGKSSTVSVLAGLLPVDRGRLSLNGRVLDDAERDVFVEPPKRRIGVVFQQYLLFDHLDVLDNIGFGVVAAGASRKKARMVAQTWADRFGLSDRGHVYPPELSGGQAQRVALARALATEPDLLLLDEPLAALDVATRTSLRRSLADHLRSYDGPRLLITHDPTDAFLLADEIHILENGRITQRGTSDELRRRPATPYVAALAGVNLLAGSNSGGRLAIEGAVGSERPAALDDFILRCADTSTSGAVLVTIHPNAIALHAEEPHGSPRNSWPTKVAEIEPLGDVTRVVLGPPLELSADITPGAASALALEPGGEVWVSIKATEISLNPA